MPRTLPVFEIVWRDFALLLEPSKTCRDALVAGPRINETKRMKVIVSFIDPFGVH
jgi:hypothetical protein